MPERFELGDLVYVHPKRQLCRVVGFRRWSGYCVIAIVAEAGAAHDQVPDYALEHAEDAITRLGRLAKGI